MPFATGQPENGEWRFEIHGLDPYRIKSTDTSFHTVSVWKSSRLAQKKMQSEKYSPVRECKRTGFRRAVRLRRRELRISRKDKGRQF